MYAPEMFGELPNGVVVVQPRIAHSRLRAAACPRRRSLLTGSDSGCVPGGQLTRRAVSRSRRRPKCARDGVAPDAWLLAREPVSDSRACASRAGSARRGEWTPARRRYLPRWSRWCSRSPVVASATTDALGLGACWGALRAGEPRRAGAAPAPSRTSLAARLAPELEQGRRRDLVDKVRQVRQALAVERAWSKDEILEARSQPRVLPRRSGKASTRPPAPSPGKGPGGLFRAEAALLACPQSCAKCPRAVIRRACALGSGRQVRGAPARVSRRHGGQRASDGASPRGDAPHLAGETARDTGRGAAARRWKLQRFAAASLGRHLREVDGRNVEDGAVIAIDNPRG